MSFESVYRLNRLEEVKDTIRKRYPSYLEFIKSDHSENIKRILDTLSHLKGNMLLKYSVELRNSELEYVLLALSVCSDERICCLLESILELRFRRKLYELNWVMLQMDFTNRNLLLSMSRLAICLKIKYPEDYAISIFSKLDAGDGWNSGVSLQDSILESIHLLLVSENVDVHTFCKRYAISADSALAKKVSELFFLKCSKDGFLRNRTVFTGLLEDMDAINAAPLIACYLDKLEVKEYFDELNYSIKERFGEFGGSAGIEEAGFWEQLPKAYFDKFLSWQGLKRIEAHFGKSRKRFSFWAGYFNKLKKVIWNEDDGLLFMDFGRFVVVDSKGGVAHDSIEVLSENSTLHLTEGSVESSVESSVQSSVQSLAETSVESSAFDLEKNEKTSYIVDRKYFDDECERYELEKVGNNGRCRWRIIAEHVVDAKALILEDIESEVYRVGYNKVQLLYLKEILRVKLEDNT